MKSEIEMKIEGLFCFAYVPSSLNKVAAGAIVLFAFNFFFLPNLLFNAYIFLVCNKN